MITDKFNRTFNYLRFSLTENCNLRCVYCMPEENQPQTLSPETLSLKEVKTVLQIFSDSGVTKVRFTGGEPMLRPDFGSILEMARTINGIEEIHVTTNGLLVEKWLPVMKNININGINISLDTLDPDNFTNITKRNGFEKIFTNIDLVKESTISNLKINVVIIRGMNDHEIPEFIEFAKEKDVTIRFIEFMPFDGGQLWNADKVVSVNQMLDQIKLVTPLIQSVGTLTEKFHFTLPKGKGKIALIPAYSRTICKTCNRIRITHDGKLMNCLYSKQFFDLGKLIRTQTPVRELKAFIHAAMAQKAVDGFAAEQSHAEFHPQMSSIGG